MYQRQSQRLGWGTVLRPHTVSKPSVRVYRALLPLQCQSCGRGIRVEERFSRGRAGIAICWLCQPFEVAAEESPEDGHRPPGRGF